MIEQQTADANVVGDVLVLIDEHDARATVEIGQVVLTQSSVDSADIAAVMYIISGHRRFDGINTDTCRH
jgi:hypothetical protein